MKIRFLFLCFLYVLVSCSENASKEKSNSLFEELAPSDHGIDFSNDIVFTPELNIIEYLYFNNGGGIAIGDFDNDNLEDLYFTANQKPDRLYRNLGNLKFEDVTESSGISNDLSWSTGVTIDDVNGDGYKDIYVCKVAPISEDGTHNLLYINLGNGTFKEMSGAYGLDFSGYSTQASFFDYDKDGDLDMYLLNHSVHSTNSYGSVEKRTISDRQSGDRLFENRLNDEESTFVDVTKTSGIFSSALGYGLGLVTADLNDDGWTDIYVGNDFHDNDYLYINNGDGSFSESISSLMTHCSQFSMGVDVADISGDGLNDVFTTDMMAYKSNIMLKSGGNDSEQIVRIKRDFGYLPQYSRNMMQVNNGQGGFMEVGLMTETFASDWSWSVLLQDFNRSGNTDIFISNGIINRPNDLDYIDYINVSENRRNENESAGDFNQRLIDQMPTLRLPNLLFHQSDTYEFTNVHAAEIGTANYSNGAAYADLDRDGDLDIVTNNINGPIGLLKNKSVEGHYLSFELGLEKNAKIEVWAGGMKQVKEYTTTRGYQSASTHSVYFGLGNVSDVDSVKFVWLDGSSQIEKEVSIDQHIKIKKSVDAIIVDANKIDDHEFQLKELSMSHKENEFDDLNNEPLMPYRLSQEGPAALYEDFNNDGIKDLFIGGSKNESINYYRGDKNGQFIKMEISTFTKDRVYEDVDADVLDFNADGYKDIYVVSGGNEYSEQDKNLEDRIYINDQDGGFFRLPISLPLTNGSCVSVMDYNKDGFDDFFVGSRNIPGAFGISPVSFLINNVKGQRLEIAARMRFGMVTDAIWTDVDNDQSPDLCVTTDWGPIKILSIPQDSSVLDITESLGIPDVKGVFRSIEVGDVNTDGRRDFFLGNMGHNTSWHINSGDSITMHLADLDKNTYVDPIIFRKYFGDPAPFADKMTLKNQVPSINKIFSSYREYSSFTSLDKLELDDELPIQHKSLNTLSSILLLSIGDGYEVIELPNEVQISNIEDMLWIDEGSLAGSLLYVGNDDSRGHNLGQTLSSTGGILTNFSIEKKQFQGHKSFPIPIGVTSKHIMDRDNNEYIIINNDHIQYLLEIK